MKTTTKRLASVAGALALGLTAAHAQSDALLDALVKKGVLTGKEAQEVRTSEMKNYSESPNSQISISKSVQKLTLYGDARLRFEYADEKAQSGLAAPVGGGKSGDNINERNRYRLRIGADYVFTDNFKAGVELETGAGNDSANQTLGSAYNKAAINVGLVYLQWSPTDWLTLTGGKQHNPLYTTDLVWDADINPEGASEVVSYTFPFGGGSAPMKSHDPKDMKDAKEMAPAPADPGMSLTVGFTGFQGIYVDNNEFNGTPLNDTDSWQFVEQVPVQFNFNKATFVKIVPGFDTYMGGGNAGPGGGPAISSGGGTQSFTAINATDDLALVTAPGEFDFKLAKEPMKFYWDFAVNLDGHSRVQDVYLKNGTATGPSASELGTQRQNRDLSDNVAWLAGLQVGQNKKKGDWSLKADYRQVGLGSVDPNLNDSDWGDSFLNQQGVKVQGQYNFTDFLIGSISVYDTWAYKSSLLNGLPGQNPTGLQVATGAAGTTASAVANLAGVSQTQRVQVDLLWKF